MKYKLLALLTDRPENVDWSVLDEHPATKWVKDYYDTYGSLPTLELFAQECLEEGEKPIATAPWAYYVREANDVKFVQAAGKSIEKFNNAYANDPKAAILALRDEFIKLNEPTANTFVPADIAEQTRERWERFRLRQGARIKTGIQPFDEASGGISPDDEFMILSARLGIGKALKYGTKVLSPSGKFVPIEDFKVGDYLVARNGKPTKILKVRDFDKLNLYRIHFIDGTYIDCCEDHLWTLRKGKQYFTLTTKELVNSKIKDIGAGTGISNNKGHNYYNWYLPKIDPVDFPQKDYIIPPYTMGVLLGDGTLSSSNHTLEFTSFDSEIVEAVRSELPDTLILGKLKSEGGWSIKWKKQKTYKHPYVQELTRLNAWGKAYDKHIPLEYLTGSVQQRLELLAGLIDTDGYIPRNKNKTSQIQITLSSEQLIDDIRYLIESLGGYARKVSAMGYYNVDGKRKYTHMTYTLTFSFAMPLPLRGPKKDRFKIAKVDRVRPIVNIEPIEAAGGRCFIVDNDEHLFLTEHFIPTHNSFILHYIALEMAKQGLNVGLYSGEMSEYEVGSRIDTWLTHVNNFDLTRGKLEDSSAQEKAYAEGVPGKILVLTPHQIGRNATPSDLRKFIKEQNLSVLLIDQLSLMQPDGRQTGEMFEQFANLSMQLKALQQELRVPIIAVSQLNRAAAQQEVDATNISGSDRIGQDATIILALERKDNELVIKVLKGRSFKKPEKGWTFVWDINTGVLSSQATVLDALSAEVEAAAKSKEMAEASKKQEQSAAQQSTIVIESVQEVDEPHEDLG